VYGCVHSHPCARFRCFCSLIQILDLYAKKIKLDPAIDLNSIARGTPGLTGADLYHLLNSACLRASKLNKPQVELSDLEHAKDKILMGAERVSAVNSLDVRKRVAYYESGKSLAALLTPAADPLHKVTVIQRGSQLGKTTQQRASNEDRVSNTYTEYLAKLDVLVAGRVAEEIVYGKDGITTAATKDLHNATQIARQMIMAYGYSDKTGLVSHARTDFTAEASHSTKLDIDHEVQSLLSNAHARVTEKLTNNVETLHRVASALLEHEVLDGAQLKTIVAGGELPPPLAKLK
jgi:ATP-dependent metalloprotease